MTKADKKKKETAKQPEVQMTNQQASVANAPEDV
jgi:hypothetical protein